MLDHFNLPRLRRQLSKYLPQIKLAGLIIGAGLFVFALYSVIPPLVTFTTRILKGPSSIISFTRDPAENLKTTLDRTNILLLGIGGAGHEAPDLTDSILLVSYHHPDKRLTLISLPRDIWVESMKAKVNTAYYYGNQKQTGGGLILAKAAAEEITGLPVHYGFVINFAGFRDAIDLVGGVDIDIERSFDDYKYPIPGMEDAQPEELRYEHLHFDAGLEHMNGERALKYVRSRNAEGEEGNDFARATRQRKVLLAFKDQVLTTKTLLNAKKINELIDLYAANIDTDITDTEYSSLAKIALTVDRDTIHSIALTTGDPAKGELGILENPPQYRYEGQWVLIARDNNWEALRQYIANQLAQ